MKKQTNGLYPTYESSLLDQGYQAVVGIDEVGRGAWAGPMYVCGYIFTREVKYVDSIRDSKTLSRRQRELVYEPLANSSVYRIESVIPDAIDKIGLTKCMVGAFQKIADFAKNTLGSKVKIKYLVDGNSFETYGSDVEFIIRGDNKYYSIASASILAKVERDRLMEDIDREHPGYLFASNVGYGTAQHRKAIEENGLVAGLHRNSYIHF